MGLKDLGKGMWLAIMRNKKAIQITDGRYKNEHSFCNIESTYSPELKHGFGMVELDIIEIYKVIETPVWARVEKTDEELKRDEAINKIQDLQKTMNDLRLFLNGNNKYGDKKYE